VTSAVNVRKQDIIMRKEKRTRSREEKEGAESEAADRLVQRKKAFDDAYEEAKNVNFKLRFMVTYY
jgi:hypothetical protein